MNKKFLEDEEELMEFFLEWRLERNESLRFLQKLENLTGNFKLTLIISNKFFHISSKIRQYLQP